MKNTPEGIKSRLDKAEDQINELEDKVETNTQSQQQNEKRLKKNKDTLRELQHNMQSNNIHITGISQWEEKKQEIEKLFGKKNRTENFLKLVREKVMQVQEAQKVPIKMNPKRFIQRQIIIKMANFKDEENNTGCKGETASNIQWSSNKVISWFFNRNTTSQKGLAWNIPGNKKQGPTTKTTLSSNALL